MEKDKSISLVIWNNRTGTPHYVTGQTHSELPVPDIFYRSFCGVRSSRLGPYRRQLPETEAVLGWFVTITAATGGTPVLVIFTTNLYIGIYTEQCYCLMPHQRSPACCCVRDSNLWVEYIESISQLALPSGSYDKEAWISPRTTPILEFLAASGACPEIQTKLGPQRPLAPSQDQGFASMYHMVAMI